MDDYKRQLYMEAQRMIRETRGKYCCVSVFISLVKEGTYGWTNAELEELFPELFALFDGNRHFKDGGRYKIERKDAWWESGWKEPRIRALDCILNMGV